jgi:hypothetical protein
MVFSVIHSTALNKLSNDMHSHTFCLDVYYFIFLIVKMRGVHMPGAHMPRAQMPGRRCRGAHAWVRTCRGRVRCIPVLYSGNRWRTWPNNIGNVFVICDRFISIAPPTVCYIAYAKHLTNSSLHDKSVIQFLQFL